jgi:hypothetical protein
MLRVVACASLFFNGALCYWKVVDTMHMGDIASFINAAPCTLLLLLLLPLSTLDTCV